MDPLGIRKGMRKYNVKSVTVTEIKMHRQQLITKEVAENFCKGKELLKEFTIKKEGKMMEDSVNDDLESFIEDIRLGKELDAEVKTYFVPKLTEEEMELAGKKDKSYFETFSSRDPDVEETEMMFSDSDSKFAKVFCDRTTFTIENSLRKKICNCCSNMCFLTFVCMLCKCSSFCSKELLCTRLFWSWLVYKD